MLVMWRRWPKRCRTGIYRAAYRRSAAARHLRQALRARQHLVRMRTQSLNLRRAVLRHEGLRLPSGQADTVPPRVAQLAVPARLPPILAPVVTMLHALTAALVEAERRLQARATEDPISQRLMTAPGVGPIVALTFQAVVDDPQRFGGDAQRLTA